MKKYRPNKGVGDKRGDWGCRRPNRYPQSGNTKPTGGFGGGIGG